MIPSSHYLACEGRELHYTEWGAGQPEVVLAWHGLARTGRDMDDIAAHLAAPDRNQRAPPARRPGDAALRPGDGALVRGPPRRLRPVAGLGCAAVPGAGAARCAQRPAAARGGRGPAPARPARGGGHGARLRPCAGAEHARAVHAGGAFLQGLNFGPERRASAWATARVPAGGVPSRPAAPGRPTAAPGWRARALRRPSPSRWRPSQPGHARWRRSSARCRQRAASG